MGRAIAQAVSRWLPTAAARVRSRIWSSGICGGQTCAGAADTSAITILLNISSSAYGKRCCKDRPIRFVFSLLQFSGPPPCAHFPKLQTIVHYDVCQTMGTPLCSCYTVYGYPPVNFYQVIHPLQLLLSHSQQDGLVGHHATFERASENFSTNLWTALRDEHFVS
jgi:hypothetical protein